MVGTCTGFFGYGFCIALKFVSKINLKTVTMYLKKY